MKHLILENEEIGRDEANNKAENENFVNEDNISAEEENSATEQETVFEPQIIGLGSEREVNKAISFYAELTKKCNLALNGIAEFLGTEVSIDFFVVLVKSKKANEELLRKYAELKKINIPGISLDKVIQSGWIDHPVELLENAVEGITNVNKWLQQLEAHATSCNLCYPLRKLFKDNKFGLTDEFEQVAVNHFRRFTTCQEQNEALELLNNLAEAINAFHYRGLLDLNRNPTGALNKLLEALDFERNGSLATIQQHAFYNRFIGVPNQTSVQEKYRQYREVFA
jgi:hypothetical protein